MRLHPRCAAVTVALVVPTLSQTVHAGVVPAFHLIAREGDPFPGRPGFTYDGGAASPFIGARSNDPSGDIYFQARGTGPDGSETADILVYRHATHTVESYVRSGELIDGSTARLFWGTVGGAQPGTVAHIVRLADGAGGAVVVSGPEGSRFVAARQGDAAPGQAFAFTDVGLASGSFLDVNMNSTGIVSFGGRFRDANNTLQYGYYLTRPGGAAERIIDSTMPVPGRPDAHWVNSDQITAPFDIYTPGLDAEGNAYFRAKYNDGVRNYRAFYRRNVDGSITAIADAGSVAPVPAPGMPEGTTYLRFRTAANNQRGDAAFGAELNNADGTFFGTGIFRALAGQSVEKVIGTGDSIFGIPEAVNPVFGLSSMNNTGHLLITANYFLAGLGGQSLILSNPDGSFEPVLKFNQTPGFPGQRAGLTQAADLNARGDAVFITHMNMTSSTDAAFAYLNDTDTLVPILKTGDVLDGLTVVTMSLGGGANDPMGSVGASGGPVAWDDARNLSLLVTLRDDAGSLSTALYAVQVPTPGAGALSLLALGGVACMRRR